MPGCEKPIKWDVFMCRQHWYQVPAPLRRDVNDSWQERQRALRDPRADYDFAADLHERAKAAALRAVEERSDVR